MERYRVCFADTDAGGIVYHARYFEMAERSRNEALRHVRMAPARLLRDARAGVPGTALVVHRASAKYHAPAFADDLLELRNRIAQSSGARLIWKTYITREERPICSVEVELVSMDPASGMAMMIAPSLIAAIDEIARSDGYDRVGGGAST